MSVREVPMYRIECNACGSGDEFSDFYAWAEESQAVEMWRDETGVVLSNGFAFHSRCLPPDYCRFPDDPDTCEHVPDDEAPDTCANCELPISVAAGVGAGNPNE